jgi:hypothetical protein|tara:strand:- start:283 stop:504 length:222 start_codon:yes stop_codon:yes gene_type:complete
LKDLSENNSDEIQRFISTLRTCGFIILAPEKVCLKQVKSEMKTLLRHTVNEPDFNELYEHLSLHIDGMSKEKT